MRFLIPLFVISFTAALEGEMHHQVKLTLPDNVLLNDDLYGECSLEGERAPYVRVKFGDKCNLKILETEKISKYYITRFVVKNVTRTCHYQCFLSQSRKAKKVSVVGMSVQ